MKNKLQIWTAMWFLLVVTVSAVPVNYETTMVSRVVGENADDMRIQLMKDAYTLQDAGLYTEPSYETKLDLKSIMSSQFTGFITTDQLQPGWSFSDVKDKLKNNKNNLLVLASDVWTGTPYDTYAGSANDATKWNLQKSNLILFDSYASGMHTRGRQSFASVISKRASYVAPLSHTSPNFVKAFICTLGKYPILGEVFRQARNTYYTHTNMRSEFLGLTMLSYAMYGPPLVSVSNQNWDTTQRKNLCVDYDKSLDIADAGEFSIAEADGVYTKEVSLDLGEPAVGIFEGFSTITTDKTLPRMAKDQLVTPFRTEVTRFPLNTVISNVSLIGFEDAVDITVSDIPEWNGTEAQQRNCYLSTENAKVEFSYGQTEDSLMVIAQISPVDVLNCATGELKFYKKVKYNIKYLPESPVLFKDITYSSELIPNQTSTVQVEVENTQTTPAQGLFVLSGPSGTVSVINTTVTQSSYSLELQAPENEGRYRYKIEFVQNGQSKTYAEFDIDVKVLEAELIVPEYVGSTADVTLEVTNKLATELTVSFEDQLVKDNTLLANKTQTVTLSPGKNIFTLTYNELKKSDESYDVYVNIPYLENNKQVYTSLVTNHEPIILQGDVYLKEGEVLNITPTAIDYDNDLVTLNVNSSFPIDGSYTFDYNESGVYTMIITASDGLLTAEKTIQIVVDNTNRAPILTVPEVINGKENQTTVMQLQASDPDNQNDVTNDDNDLKITYGWPFNENGTYTPDFEMSGNITTFVSVSDGELIDGKEVILVIENTDRPPHLDNLTDITIKEGEWVYGQKGRDSDNENNVIDDDNTLIYRYFNVPLDHEGKWKTTYDNSGVYDLKVEVSDGDLGTTKTVKLTVENVNRPPLITAQDVIEAQGTVDLSAYVTDPDNTNTATNDDNVLTVTYGGSPFDANGVWLPTIPDSTAYTTITVSDGEFTVSKNIYVHVAEVNVPAQQTPPQPIQSEEPPVELPVEETTVYEPVGEAPEVEEIFSTEPTAEAQPEIEDVWARIPEEGEIIDPPEIMPEQPTTITGLDLYEYPFFFIENGIMDSVLVVGEAAPSVHVVGAVDMAYGIRQMTGKKITVKLDSEITAIGNLISIGGPCDNTITRQITGPIECTMGLNQNEGIIKLYNLNGKRQVVVAGYNDRGTRAAARVLAEWGKYQTHGTELIVKGERLSNITVEAQEPVPASTILTWAAQPQTNTQETVEQPEELEVEVKVRSKKVDDGDSVKVKPDSEFKVKIDVTNNAETEKDVDIEVSIDDLDQEEEDSTTLDPGDSEDFTYEFDIPRITDDDEYDLDIFVKDGTQTKKWNILLKIDKPTHEIIITQFSLTPVTCGQISSQARIQLANTGKNDEDGTMHIEGVQDIPFELTEGEERQYTQTLTSLKPGIHPITTTVDYGKQTVQQTEQLTVETCKQEETAIVNAEPEQEQVLIQSGQKEAKPVSLQSEGIPSKDIISIAFVILSTLFAVTLIIFAIRLGRQY